MKITDKYNWDYLHNSPLLRILSLLSVACLIYYLWWRATETLNPDALVFSWVLLSAEAFGVFNYILFAWMTQDVSPLHPHKPPKPGISIDIFIPTYWWEPGNSWGHSDRMQKYSIPPQDLRFGWWKKKRSKTTCTTFGLQLYHPTHKWARQSWEYKPCLIKDQWWIHRAFLK